jgi:tRNA(fMet)-specific endonuclease VapC
LSLRFLLDTNVVSEPLRPDPSAGVLRRLERHDGEIAIASIVWHELRFGCGRLPRSRRRSAIERYLEDVVASSFPVLDYDRAAAEWHAEERARLAGRGRTPSFVDGQIAAVACVHDLVLVTSNKTDFANFRGVTVRTWS